MRAGRAARALRRLSAFGLLVSSACVVTDEVHFLAPSNPTSVQRVSPFQFTHYPFGGDPACQPFVGEGMQFVIHMQDRDVEEELFGFWLVNGEPGDPRGGFSPFPVTSPLSVDREASYCIPKASFKRSCNLVQVVIANYIPDQRSGPLVPNSLGVATTDWFVRAPADEQPEASPLSCETLFDAGVDAGVDGGDGGEGGVP